MYIKIDQMPSSSKIWIYQSSEALSSNLQKIFSQKLEAFLSGWESHGQPVNASWELLYDRFIIIAVDDQSLPSGCSIDKSVHFLQTLETELSIRLFDRSNVAILENEVVNTYNLKNLKDHIKEGKITPKSLIFDTLIPTLGELKKMCWLPAEKTWVSRFF